MASKAFRNLNGFAGKSAQQRSFSSTAAAQMEIMRGGPLLNCLSKVKNSDDDMGADVSQSGGEDAIENAEPTSFAAAAQAAEDKSRDANAADDKYAVITKENEKTKAIEAHQAAEKANGFAAKFAAAGSTDPDTDQGLKEDHQMQAEYHLRMANRYIAGLAPVLSNRRELRDQKKILNAGTPEGLKKALEKRHELKKKLYNRATIDYATLVNEAREKKITNSATDSESPYINPGAASANDWPYPPTNIYNDPNNVYSQAAPFILSGEPIPPDLTKRLEMQIDADFPENTVPDSDQ